MVDYAEQDMTIDVPWGDTQEERTGQMPPDVGEQEFEIAKVFKGVQKQGENIDEPYVNLLCKQMSGEFPGTKSCFKFLGFGRKMGKRGTTQAGETKGFLADIGRDDLFSLPAFDPTDLIGTTFLANVAHSTNPKNGQTSVWLNNPRPNAPQYQTIPSEETIADIKAIEEAAAVNVTEVVKEAMAEKPQAPVVQTPAPVVDPRPAMPRRVRPTAR